MIRDFIQASKEAIEYYNVDLSKIPEDDRLYYWPWSKKYLDEINDDMARGAFDSMLQMLDIMEVPKGTYSDDRLRNFVAMYTRRGEIVSTLSDTLESLRDKNEFIDESYARLQEYNNRLVETLLELANWPIHGDNQTAKDMRIVASSVVDPAKVKFMQPLLD